MGWKGDGDEGRKEGENEKRIRKKEYREKGIKGERGKKWNNDI